MASYKDMRDGVIAFNKAVLKGIKNPEATPAIKALLKEKKLVIDHKRGGILAASPEFYERLSNSREDEAKAVAETLAKGREMQAKAGKADKSEQAEKPAKAEKEAKFDPEEVLATLNKAVTAGNLDGFSAQELTIVAVQGPERKKYTRVADPNDKSKTIRVPERDAEGKNVMEPNPHAGKIGLTPNALSSMKGYVRTLTAVIENPKTTQGRAKEAQVQLTAATEALTLADKSMGIDRTKTVEAEKDHEPAPGE